MNSLHLAGVDPTLGPGCLERRVIGGGQRSAEPVRGRDLCAMQVQGDFVDHELFPRPTWP